MLYMTCSLLVLSDPTKIQQIFCQQNEKSLVVATQSYRSPDGWCLGSFICGLRLLQLHYKLTEDSVDGYGGCYVGCFVRGDSGL